MSKNNSIFTACGDLHITNEKPAYRKSGYYKQVLNKFSQILKITNKYSHNGILIVAGDFFNSTNVPYKTVRDILEIIQKSNVPNILVVPGQHDLRYHVKGLDNTPLGILSTAKVVKILGPNKVETINGITFSGAGWGEDPKIKSNVLVMHKMITKDGPNWNGQTDYLTAKAVLDKYKFADCIISGDNHIPHLLKQTGKRIRLQVNCGSMMRSTKTQIEFNPRVYLIDYNSKKTKMIKLNILPPEDVFNFGSIDRDNMKEDAKLKAEKLISDFIETLPDDKKDKPKFQQILHTLVEQINPRKGVKNIINEIMEKIN